MGDGRKREQGDAGRPGAGGAARLYRAGEDAVWVLDSGSVRGATANSSAAWLVQFYSSWCGHCIGYAPTWRALAGDVRDWASAIRVAALDCMEEKNQAVCHDYDIHFYPTFRVSITGCLSVEIHLLPHLPGEYHGVSCMLKFATS
ncbi:PREDICTED: sulfhydryl oxidase 2-like [Rhinopithecus bieti]|uniref:sulfhydryl oxidase 2-like n=1 Tax=Rhinopithecus bieti TaxID=61621 RepID=UPI00083C2DBB|nr:PREDICTED: sulfhydryl oxidase 2-like [Rhinopithecus bieti]